MVTGPRGLACARAPNLGRELDRDLGLTLDHAWSLKRVLDHEVAEHPHAAAEALVGALSRARRLSRAISVNLDLTMTNTLTWIGSGAGAIGSTLALVAVYSSDRDRRSAAEKILNRLLATLPGGRQGAAEVTRRTRGRPPEGQLGPSA